LMTMMHGFLAAGIWKEERGSNILDGGAPFARSYRTLDDKYLVMKARGTFVNVDGVNQAAPAPRFSRTPSSISRSAGVAETDIRGVLEGWGASEKVLRRL